MAVQRAEATDGQGTHDLSIGIVNWNTREVTNMCLTSVQTGLKGPVDMISDYNPDKHSSALIYRKYCVDLSRLDQPEVVAVFWPYLPKFGRLRWHLRRASRFRGWVIEAIIHACVARWFRPNARVEAEVACRMCADGFGTLARGRDRNSTLSRPTGRPECPSARFWTSTGRLS